MAEVTPRTLNHFACVAFTDAHWALPVLQRAALHQEWLARLRDAARVYLYQVFPTEAKSDVMVWSAMPADRPEAAAEFFERFARAFAPVRHLVTVRETLWGFTRPSEYTKVRSAQEIDPFDDERRRYVVVYPFVKTSAWYLKSREERQTLMNGHIRVGKQYPDIRQLLLYSFGLQDQEFVVVYEMDDLTRFSALVNELRSTEARVYTERDAPLHTGVYRPGDEALALWR